MPIEPSTRFKVLIVAVATGVVLLCGFLLSETEQSSPGSEGLGFSLFVPLVLVFLCCTLANTQLGAELDDFKIAIGITSAQAVFHLLGALLAGNEMLVSVMPDIVVLSVGVAWLILRPGVFPVALLIIYEAFAIILNLVMAFRVGLGAIMAEDLISMLLICAAAIYFLASGLTAWRAKVPHASHQAPRDGIAAS